MAERRYSISQAGRLVGVENHVLRYWEDELHLEIPRDRKNQRYYTKLHIEMFQKINELKEKGYQLKAIEPVLKRMLDGEKDLDLNEALRQNAVDILRHASAGAVQLEPEMAYRYADTVKEAPGTGYRNADEARKIPGTGYSSVDEAGIEPGTGYRNADAAPEKPDEGDSMNEESAERNMNGEGKAEVAARTEEEPAVMSQQEKLEQFQQLMNHIIGNAIGQAMRQNNEALSEEISRQVNDRMVQELEYMMRISDEKEEERFKALDETLRAHQKENKGKAEAAAARMPFFRKKKFGRSGKKL